MELPATPPAAPPPATPPATPPPDSPPPATPPPAAPPAATPPTPTTPHPASPPAAEPENLLAEPPPAAPPAAPSGTPPANPPGTPPDSPPPPDEKAVAEIVKGMTDAITGDEKLKAFPLDTEGIKALAPLFIEAGLDQAKAGKIAKALVSRQQAQMDEFIAKDKEMLSQMVAATKAELGADMPAFVQHARAGGRAVFGDELWAELSSVAAFGSDVRVIKALAAVGRSVATDTGAGAKPAGSGEEKDFFQRWTTPPGKG